MPRRGWRSARGRLLIDFAQDPQSPRANHIQLTAAERSIFSIRERSSYQLRDGCFIPDVQPPSPLPSGRASTRSQMLAQRRIDWVADNERTSIPVDRTTTLPVGVKPGAPGARPITRYTHLDTNHGLKYWWGASAM